ncbi:MAG: O-antigen ligase family protein [Alphaproteobacteria bacterium]|nr:O-antigen ligase family protein [Alphaproteobacteria bacterium]MBO7551604.1 O-antigen ligase family protein [Fibrobacter sp.]
MKWNRYDSFLVLLISSLALGGFGGAISIPRVLAIALSPVLLCRIVDKRCIRVYWFCLFFIIWYLYAAISLFWTSNLNEAFKEMVYYPVHFVFFLEIVVFSFFARNPLRHIALGWCIGFLGTSIIAGWELLTDNHLFMSKQQSGLMQNYGYGDVFLRHFCSVTFGNYNSYVTYIAFAFPFLLYLNVQKKFNRLVSILCLVLPFFFIFENASRGGILSIAGMLFVFLMCQKRNNKKLIFLIALVFVAFVYVLSFTDTFTLIFVRMGKTSLDESRFGLWNAAINLWESTFFIGSGIGSMVTSMSDFSTRLLITHNLFLEVLVQYGFVVFTPIIFYYFSCFLRTLKKNDADAKSVVLPALCLLPILSAIDSGYLLNPITYAFFASIEVYISYEYC